MYNIDKEKAAGRLKKIQESLDIKSDRQFALSIDADVSYFGKAMKGKIVLSDKYIKEMYSKHGVNPDYYRYGKGGMFDEYNIDLLNDPQAAYGKTTTVKFSNIELHKLLGSVNERLIRIEAHIEVYESAIAGLQSKSKDDFMQKVGGLRLAVKEVTDRRFSELSQKYG